MNDRMDWERPELKVTPIEETLVGLGPDDDGGGGLQS